MVSAWRSAGFLAWGAAALGAWAPAAAGSRPAAVPAERLSHLGVSPERVIAVAAGFVTSVVAVSRGAEGERLVTIRADRMTPETGGPASAYQTTVAVDCTARRIRAGATIGYFGADAGGAADGFIVRPEDSEWRRPPPGTSLENTWRYACDPHFHPPLAAVATTAAALVPAPPAHERASPPENPARAISAEAAAAPASASHASSSVRAAARASRAAVQVVSATSENEARAFLQRLQGRLPAHSADLEASVARAAVGSHTVYRGLLSGFADPAGAAGFCASLKARGVACLVRPRG